MPRTKRPTAKRQTNTSETSSAEFAFKKTIAEQKMAQETAVQSICLDIDLAFKMMVNSMDSKKRNMTIGQLKNLPSGNTLLHGSAAKAIAPKLTSRGDSQDDGYLTESSVQSEGVMEVSRSSRTRDRSGYATASTAKSCTSRRRSRSTGTTQPHLPPPSTYSTNWRSRSAYKTPMCNRAGALNYPLITPKVHPNTPLTVLRRPRQGEMVVSMSGSPLMVPTMQQEDKANCNIPLYDGTMLSVMPEKLRVSQNFIPVSLMKPDVMQQLRTLQENLDTVLRMGESARK